jgi:hypothetical protein
VNEAITDLLHSKIKFTFACDTSFFKGRAGGEEEMAAIP